MHDAHKDLGINYVAEPDIDIAGQTRSVDFVIQDRSGAIWYWEHLGMLTDDAYRRRWERKLALYRQAGIWCCPRHSGHVAVEE